MVVGGNISSAASRIGDNAILEFGDEDTVRRASSALLWNTLEIWCGTWYDIAGERRVESYLVDGKVPLLVVGQVNDGNLELAVQAGLARSWGCRNGRNVAGDSLGGRNAQHREEGKHLGSHGAVGPNCAVGDARLSLLKLLSRDEKLFGSDRRVSVISDRRRQ